MTKGSHSHPNIRTVRLVLGILLISLLGLPSVFAGGDGIYIETLNRSAGLMGEAPREELSKTYLAHGKMRVAGPDQRGTDMILDPATGTLTFLNHATREYYRLNVKDMMAGMSQPGIDQMRAMVEDTQVKVEETGETKRIGSWNCKEYRVVKTGMMGVDQEIWATEDVAFDVTRFTEMMSLSGPDALLANSAAGKSQRAEMSKIKGYPILTKTRMQLMGTTMETERLVTTIREEPIPSSLFEIPEGYSLREMGTGPGTEAHP